MNSLNNLFFLFVFVSSIIGNALSVYTHAAFVNDVRRSQQKYRKLRSSVISDPSEEYSLQMNNTALFGLQPCSHMQCEKIAIVGAGVTGLTIAYELTRAGYEVIVFEANKQAGGRLFTFDTEKTIIELGGMRLPLDIHTLTDIYIRKRFNLPLEPFISSHPNTFVYINGIRYRSDNTSFLPNEYNLQVYSPFDRWNEAVKPLFDLFYNQGWNAVVKKYGSYNVRQYLIEFGLSNMMIDYIGLMFGIETNLYTALTSHFRDALLINAYTKFYHIIGGNKRLIESLSEPCQINYSTSVLAIHRNEDKTINITIKNSMNITNIMKFNRVVVATTAPAARFIHYTPIDEQVKRMSRALRQLHYDCASKLVLYFNRSWWHDQNIYGGSSTTDLPVRFIYYDNYNTTINGNNHTESVLLASYTFAQDSTLWSSSTIDQITDQVLSNLEEIHARSDIRQFYLRTVVKHWCTDSFSHGAYALFLPYQEETIKPILMESFDKLVYFAGEHISTAHAWVEGSILSALRILIQLQQEKFDIVIVGGGLLALQTAIELSKRQPTWHILLLEEYSFLNNTCLNQFESSSTNRATKEYLHFGPNLINGQFNSTDLMNQFYFENLPTNYRGQFNGKLEFLNTTKMIIDSLNILKQDKYINITICENERFINNIQNQIITNRREITVNHKILFLDNCYLNDYIKELLQPFKISIKTEQFPLLSFPLKRTNSLITWLYNNQLLGYDSNDTKSEQRIILLNSNVTSALSWLNEHASSFIDINQINYESDYKQTTLIDQDHIIDYLPNSSNRSILFIGRTNIDLYPIWIDILIDLTLNIYKPSMSNYSILLPNQFVSNSSFQMSISMNIIFFYFLLLLFLM
ncbi:unnamed protein product [Rotaria sp. Silwood2]|nr:unnamed protein product [Rotaria sp. Silwood2]CAF3435160.1 unnamed protein product [Rotaria sp. Silwood2]CAF4507179.1 unnamed protein product [Rotaria sp. Silwood2]